jgi:uncharacterized protein YndB with AHSA1/START domain
MAELTVKHRFDAPPEEVFDAWLDPTRARRFLFTTAESEVIDCEIEPRVGGDFRIIDHRHEQGDVDHVGEFLEIDRPRRLAFTFGVPQFDETMSRVTLELAPSGGGCELTLTQQDVPDEWVEPTRSGWSMILDAEARALREAR